MGDYLIPKFSWSEAVSRQDTHKCLENALRIQYVIDRKETASGQFITMQAYDIIREQAIGETLEFDDVDQHFAVLKLASIKRSILVMFYEANHDDLVSGASELSPLLAGYLCYYETMFEHIKAGRLSALDMWITIESRFNGDHTRGATLIFRKDLDSNVVKDRLHESASAWRLQIDDILTLTDPNSMNDVRKAEVFGAVKEWLLTHINVSGPNVPGESNGRRSDPLNNSVSDDATLDEQLRNLGVRGKDVYYEEELRAAHDDLVERFGPFDSVESYKRAAQLAQAEELENIKIQTSQIEELVAVKRSLNSTKRALMSMLSQ